MNLKFNNESIIIENDGFVFTINLKKEYKNILEYITIKVDSEDVVSEVENEIDMLPCEVVSGKFVTGAFYGISKYNTEVFISRETVAFCPAVFNTIREEAKLPFYAIINRYSINSSTKQKYQFSRVFATEAEMMKVYGNTINYLKFNKK